MIGRPDVPSPALGSNRHAEADELHFELPLWADSRHSPFTR
jgi:hypothetical protein